MSFPAPLPGIGQRQRVVLDGIPMNVRQGTYVVDEAPRFGQKLSTGSLKYADFNPYESAHAIASFVGGYGLRRYSDVADPEDPSNRTMYYEADGVDCRDGIAILAPEAVDETTGLAAPAVWIGEFIPSAGPRSGLRTLVAVGGTKIVYRDSNNIGTWTDTGLTLAASAQKSAVGVFGDRLVIGYGASATAEFTVNLTSLSNVANATPANIYVGAFSADRAAAYVAGGPASTDVKNKVTSSADGGTGYSTTLTVCGGADRQIRCLAPGGGIATVYVLKDQELASIDSSGVYRILLPFETTLGSNDAGLHWWLSKDGEEQRGPVILVFTRDRSPWVYQPSGQTAGEAVNIAPWADPAIRPENIRGVPIEFQGSASWLYYIVRNNASNVGYLIARNALTGDNHSGLANLSTNACNAMCITSQQTDGQPRLYFGYGNNVRYITLAYDGDSRLDDANSRYVTSGTLTTPDIDLSFPDEPKIFFSVVVVADNLTAGAQTIEVEASIDGGAFTSLGTVSVSPSEELDFPTQSSGKRVRLRFTLSTTDATETPQLLGGSIRMSLNAKLYRIWKFTASVPNGWNAEGGEDARNPQTDLASLWSARRAGFPVEFTDRWMDTYQVRILKVKETELVAEPDRTPETEVELELLEVSTGAGNLAYGDALAAYGALSSRYA